MKIIVVEDDALIRMSLARYLQPHRVIAVGSHNEAEKAINVHSDAGIVLFDGCICGGNCFDTGHLVALAKEKIPRARLVGMSSIPEFNTGLTDAGCHIIIPKGSNFIAGISELLRQSHS